MIAASRTLRAIGPAVSWLCAIGTMPRCARSPAVGFNPTTPFIEAGHVIDPSVSVPTLATANCEAIAAALPALDPHALRSSTCGFFVKPPTALQPLIERSERK